MSYIDYEYVKRSAEKKKIPVQIGDMIFESVKDAAEFCKVSGPTLRRRMLDKKAINGKVPFRLTKEEFKNGGRKNEGSKREEGQDSKID